MYIAIKVDCFNTRFTECRTFMHFDEIEGLGIEWLVFDTKLAQNEKGSHMQLAFDYETNTHLRRPW